MKKFYTLLCAAVCVSASAFAEKTVVFNFNSGVPTEVDGVTLATACAWNDYAGALQLYKQDLTFTAPAGYTITQIVLDDPSGRSAMAFYGITLDNNGFDMSDDWNSLIWMGSQTSVTINPYSGGSAYIKKATLTLEGGPATSISSVENNSNVVTFDLNGRRANNAKGILIENGRKVIR